ncbi:MAG TPA: tetratricopeptide repeat protein, partial [Nitrospirae bacterium]|nr:tetratricopeptide repeat protein [Nitrospirota bacterium]
MRKWKFAGSIMLVFLLSGVCHASEKEYEIAITKGIYRIETGKYQEAIRNLRKALEIKPGDKNAMISLGMAYSRAGEYDNAKLVLQEALKIDPGNKRAEYELGVVLYKLGEVAHAESYFTGIWKSDADEPLKKAATSYLEIAASSRKAGKKPFSLGLLTGGQYDTNTILEPSNPSTDRGKEKDWRAIVALDADWTFLKSGSLTCDTRYLFYQSFHIHNTGYNLHQHNLSLSGRYDFTPDLNLGLTYGLSYSLAGGDLYSSINSIALDAEDAFYKSSTTGLHYGHEFKKYFDSNTFLSNSIRSGDNDAIGIFHKVGLNDKVSLTVDYTFDMDRTGAGYWDYN